MPSLVTCMSFIDGKRLPSGAGMLVLSSLVHVDSYCLFNMLAFYLGVGMKSPVVFKRCDTSDILPKGLYVRPEPFLLRLVLLIRVPNFDDIVHILQVRILRIRVFTCLENHGFCTLLLRSIFDGICDSMSFVDGLCS